MTAMAAAPDRLDYETAKQLARHLDADVRRQLGAHADTMPEILFFLVADGDGAVRETVARNPHTPQAAHAVLACDDESAVRIATAERMAAAIPSGAPGAPVEAAVVAILMQLSQDTDVAVRQALAEAVQFIAAAPHAVARRLAGDEVLAVAEPVLRHSPALQANDLLEIANDPRPGVLGAIARRLDLQPEVADVVAQSDDVDAVTVLLTNKSAQIREDTLDTVLDRAPAHQAWHRPLVERPALPPRAVGRLAEFVALSLLDLLSSRSDLSPDSQVTLAESLARRARTEPPPAAAPRPAPPARPPPPMTRAKRPAEPQTEPPAEPPTEPWSGPPAIGGACGGSPVTVALEKVAVLKIAGRLTQAVIEEAILTGDRALAVAAITVLAGVPYSTGDHILQSQSPRAVVALIWKARLPMTMAVKVQLTLGCIQPNRVIHPGGDGGYPLPRQDMEWQLMFFDVEC